MGDRWGSPFGSPGVPFGGTESLTTREITRQEGTEKERGGSGVPPRRVLLGVLTPDYDFDSLCRS